jgi:hypothetical protein
MQYEDESPDEWDQAIADELRRRLNDPENTPVPWQEALGDGACPRRRALHRPVRYIVGPLGRSRLRTPGCRRRPGNPPRSGHRCT